MGPPHAFGGYQAARTAPWMPSDEGERRGPAGMAMAGRQQADHRRAPRAGATHKRRQLAVAGLVGVAAVLGVYATGRVGGAVGGGRALGILTGDASALSPELAGPGAAPGRGPMASTDGAPAGPAATVVAPGSDGLVGTADDVVVPVPGNRGGPTSSGRDAAGGTTAPPRSTTSTSTTLPPIPTDLAVTSVEVPATAPRSTDGCGQDVAFDAARIADDQTDTAWRMEGDGTGQTITLSLGGAHRIVSVGLIPGYARTDPCDGTNRFAQNRRITRVSWQFDDGSAPVVQELRDAAEMQRVPVSAQATTVTVRIEGVTAEPERDFTAISEIDVRGT
jgi:hypothetical protein